VFIGQFAMITKNTIAARIKSNQIVHQR